MSVQDSTAQVTPIPAAKDAPSSAGVNGAVSREMSSVNQRLFNNAYFRARRRAAPARQLSVSTLLEWLPWLAGIRLAALVDGGFARLIKAKEFLQHDPEMFALYASLGIILCATVIGFVLPSDAASAAAAVRAAGGRGAGGTGGGVFSSSTRMKLGHYSRCRITSFIWRRHKLSLPRSPQVNFIKRPAHNHRSHQVNRRDKQRTSTQLRSAGLAPTTVWADGRSDAESVLVPGRRNLSPPTDHPPRYG